MIILGYQRLAQSASRKFLVDVSHLLESEECRHTLLHAASKVGMYGNPSFGGASARDVMNELALICLEDFCWNSACVGLVVVQAIRVAKPGLNKVSLGTKK